MRRYTHHQIPVKSRLLQGNPLGDPSERVLHVLAPEGPGPFPVVWFLVGFSGTPENALAHDPWSEGLHARLERLTGSGVLPEAIVVLPDCFTAYGGSQYLNSSATGPYEDHLWQELLPLVRARFPCGRHGILGKSSGGFGAFTQALRHPELIEAMVCHSGDMGFTFSLLPDLPALASALRQHGGLEGFLAAFAASPKKRDGKWIPPMNALAMAACYSPSPGEPRGIALPMDLETGALKPEVWERWLAFDPVRLADEPANLEKLSRLRLCFLDCGTRDEYQLQWGLRELTKKLKAAGVPHRHEEFDDGHRSIGYRYDVSVPLLVRALGGTR